MNNIVYHIVWLAIIALLLSSCTATQRLGSDNLRPRSEKYLMKRLVQQQRQADWLSAKFKATYSDEKDVVKFTGNLRMAKDSLVWLNVRKLNVEAARVLITPDSFFVIDRLNNEYLARDFAFLQERFQLPVNFQSFQQLLLGNPVFFTKELTSGIIDQHYSLEGSSNRFQTRYLLNGSDFSLAALEVEDKRERQSFRTGFDDYRKLAKDVDFSYLRTIEVATTEFGLASLSLEFSKVELNVPKTIRFDIPERYTEIK
jgi:hypothetical protein